MMPPMSCQWRPVIAWQVYLETCWHFWVLWVPFVTYPSDLLVCICQNLLLDPKSSLYENFWYHHHTKQHIVWDFSTDPLVYIIFLLVVTPPNTKSTFFFIFFCLRILRYLLYKQVFVHMNGPFRQNFSNSVEIDHWYEAFLSYQR